jgi:bacillopeptidase F (M6 metalloprotease family)
MQYRPAEIWKDHSNGEKAKLSLFSSVYVDAELVQWLPGFLAQEAPVQVTNAEIQSAQMSEVVGGKPDSPPTTMIRRCNFRQLSV